MNHGFTKSKKVSKKYDIVFLCLLIMPFPGTNACKICKALYTECTWTSTVIQMGATNGFYSKYVNFSVYEDIIKFHTDLTGGRTLVELPRNLGFLVGFWKIGKNHGFYGHPWNTSRSATSLNRRFRMRQGTPYLTTRFMIKWWIWFNFKLDFAIKKLSFIIQLFS